MRPLETNRTVLKWPSVYPLDGTTSDRNKMCYRIFSVSIIIIQILATGANAAFFLKFASTKLEDSLFALMQLLGMANVYFMWSL